MIKVVVTANDTDQRLHSIILDIGSYGFPTLMSVNAHAALKVLQLPKSLIDFRF